MVSPKFAVVSLLLLLTACASAPVAPPQAPAAAQDDYSIQIERRVDELIASDPSVVPSGLEVTVLSVDQLPTGLFYKVQLKLPQRRGHNAEDFVIYGQCETTDIDRCAHQIIDGAKMLKK
jgi:hypothetical protein